ncbi:MAG: sigma-70 family RNA polymerase sigma factor [Candidatus Omnitrophota bacterium]
MNDLDFVQQCIRGQGQSRDEFLKRYSRLIYKYICSVLNSKSGPALARDSSDDLFHDFFVFLIQDNCKKLKSFKAKNGCSLASWLRQVAINFTLDHLRKGRHAISLDAQDEEGLSLGGALADGSISIPELLNQEEMLKGLEDCIGALNNQSKLLIELNINHGIKLETLKDLFKVSRGAIDMQKARIIQRLRDCFEAKNLKLDF